MEESGRGKRARAVGLLSGGLDSTLAARVLQEQGVEVHGLHFATGFCRTEHRRALGRPSDLEREERVRNEALRAGSDLNVPVEIVDVSEEYLREVVLNPKHGYGSAMNPCLDCRVFMLRKAAEIAEKKGADVVFTGEVVGQRPMSQGRASLQTVERESGLQGRLLRPLSAQLLEPTEAERERRIDRRRLGRVHGRSRRRQLEMARRFGIHDFPTPSGGCCFLADGSFARRLRDYLDHAGPDGVRREDLALLKVGRHLRLAHDLKVIVARDEAECRFLLSRTGDRTVFQVADGRGAVTLAVEELGGKRVATVASVAARYSRHRKDDQVEVEVRRGDRRTRIGVKPADDDWVHTRLI